MQFLERGAGPRRPRVGCFFIRAAQCVHALDSPLSWLILNICIHILNRCVIHTKQGKLTKVLMAQLSQSSKKKIKNHWLFSSQNNTPLLWGSTRGCLAYPPQSSTLTKESVYVCAQVWEQKSWQQADIQCRAHSGHKGWSQCYLCVWVSSSCLMRIPLFAFTSQLNHQHCNSEKTPSCRQKTRLSVILHQSTVCVSFWEVHGAPDTLS